MVFLSIGVYTTMEIASFASNYINDKKILDVKFFLDTRVTKFTTFFVGVGA